MQLNRKTETIKKKREREAHLGLTCAGPAHLARPSRLALPVVVLLPPEGRGARGRRPWPHAGHLLLLPTPRTPSTSATHSPSSPSHFAHSPRAPIPPLALSPSPPERSSSPPSPSTVAIDPLSSLRRVPEHRRRLPLPHERATTPQTHCNTASAVFFHLGPPRSSATVRRP